MDLFSSIKRPTLLLDELTARQNIDNMAARALESGSVFRPHFKTHQSAVVGEWFREAGMSSITVSSVEMAKYFAAYGWDDILIAFPVNWREIDEINHLASQINLSLLLESRETLRYLDKHLNQTCNAWIKIDVGNLRTGLAWDDSDLVLALAKDIQRSRFLRLRGLLTHAGHTYRASGSQEVCAIHQQSMQRLAWLQDQLAQAGLDRLEISVGDTPSCSLCSQTGANEIRPGNFVFYDAQQLNIGACQPEQIAVAVACPVVATHPERGEAVIFGGAVHLSKDLFPFDGKSAYGLVCLPEDGRWGLPLRGAFVRGLSQEHGVLKIPEEHFDRVRVGELVCIIPAHSCLAVTLMRDFLTLDGRVIPTMNSLATLPGH